MCLQSIFPHYHSMIPPLRLVLTTDCNGSCTYCHHEGDADTGQTLTVSLAAKCAKIAEKLGLPEIALTGGEPTSHPGFSEIINQIQRIYHGNISLTTNGFLLSKHEISTPIHTINLSISSFSKNIYDKYQKVDPSIAINNMMQFPAINKNINIVVTDENYEEMESILAWCENNRIPVDIMFELKDYSPEDIAKHKHILSVIESYGRSFIELATTSTIIVVGREDFRIRIKHPKLSKLLNRQICTTCENGTDCHERLCAVRVYPNGLVSTCLNKRYKFINGDIEEKIEEAYIRLTQDKSILSALLC